MLLSRVHNMATYTHFLLLLLLLLLLLFLHACCLLVLACGREARPIHTPAISQCHHVATQSLLFVCLPFPSTAEWQHMTPFSCTCCVLEQPSGVGMLHVSMMHLASYSHLFTHLLCPGGTSGTPHTDTPVHTHPHTHTHPCLLSTSERVVHWSEASQKTRQRDR